MQTAMIADEKVEELQARLANIEKAMGYSLWDAIEEGSTVTDQAFGSWTGPSGEVCALTAAALALKARHML